MANPTQDPAVDTLWYKDAVIYELHVKTFHDSDGDGIGDFRGLIQKLDYLQELGITAIWLLPFYPSPLRDDGYDIADYYDVNPNYGTLDDFRAFLDAAHKRGLRVITELVINHTSDQNPWFQKSRRAASGSPEREFYVWSDTPEKYSDARIIFKDFETSNWSWDPLAKAYYWHRFYAHQPDLNFDNPAVHEALEKVCDFWLAMGVDGVRLDAVPYLYEREGTICENLPETHAYLKKLRAHVDQKFPGRMLLAEANQWPEDAAAYFGNGDESHMSFHFPLMPRMFMALQMEDRFPIIDILDQTPPIPDNCQWAMFLRNHDELTLEMVTDEERDYMWRVYANDPHARINLGIRRRLAPLLANSRRKMELLNTMLMSMPGTPIIYYGDEIGMGDNIYLGDRYGDETILVVVNLSRFAQSVELDLADFSGCVPIEMFSRNPFPTIKKSAYVLTLGPHSHYWFTIEPQSARRRAEKKRVVPTLTARPDLQTLLDDGQRARIEGEILPEYISTCRWFGAKARTLRQMRVLERSPISYEPDAAELWVIEASYLDGPTENYSLPVKIASAESAKNISQSSPHAVIAHFDDG